MTRSVVRSLYERWASCLFFVLHELASYCVLLSQLATTSLHFIYPKNLQNRKVGIQYKNNILRGKQFVWAGHANWLFSSYTVDVSFWTVLRTSSALEALFLRQCVSLYDVHFTFTLNIVSCFTNFVVVKPVGHGLCIMGHGSILCGSVAHGFTGSTVALHCVKADRQSQWRSPNFNLL